MGLGSTNYLNFKFLAIVFAISLSFCLIFFNQSFNSYFSQDDFYHLRTIADKSVSDLPKFLQPRHSDEQTFYRPLSREYFNFFMYKVFGLSDFVFHLVNIVLIIINGIFLIIFLKKISFSNEIVVFSSIIYWISPIHSVELFYLGSVQNLFSATFSLCTLIFYVGYITNRKVRVLVISLVFFIFALLSHESAAVLIGLLALLELYFSMLNKEKSIKMSLLVLSPFIILFVFRIFIHFQIGLPEGQQVYKPQFSINNILNSFIWFVLWCFGLPEIMTDFMTLKLNINPNFIKWYGGYFYTVFPALVLVLLVITFLTYSCRKLILRRQFFLIVSFFVLSLVPLAIFPVHKFIYYLSFSLVWFCTILGFILGVAWSKSRIYKFISIFCTFLLLVISYQTNNLNYLTHWSAKRAQAAWDIVSFLNKKYPQVKSGTVFYTKNDPNYPQIAKEWGGSSKQAFFIMSGSDAFQLLYKDTTIKAYYEDVNDLPKNVDKKNLIVISPKFRY